ncbi:hypothetical protein Bbelb_143160 [Branchiostoma belcheri]|nr:hypothetical protein Bbelb_143160 [Branchiostoma belcheri]
MGAPRCLAARPSNPGAEDTFADLAGRRGKLHWVVEKEEELAHVKTSRRALDILETTFTHIQNLPPNTSRPRLSEAPVTHSEPSPEHQPTKDLPPNTSRQRLAEAPVTHSEPSPEHQPTKNLPPNTNRPRLAEAPVTHSEPSPEHQPTKNLPPNTSRPRLAEAPVTQSEPPEHQPTKNLPPNTSRPRLAEAPVTQSEPPEHQPTKASYAPTFSRTPPYHQPTMAQPPASTPKCFKHFETFGWRRIHQSIFPPPQFSLRDLQMSPFSIGFRKHISRLFRKPPDACSTRSTPPHPSHGRVVHADTISVSVSV